ncbi:MAG: class I SAM-dependent methyltransferase [Deltaproteobacteria bacterium]|nr:class I SAM-dependent methyltransferase [Deltaproteobacteria bacterium]
MYKFAEVQTARSHSVEEIANAGKCRLCNAPLIHNFLDLGMFPLSNAYLKSKVLSRKEPFYPLRVYVCNECWLVQLEECESPNIIFSDYAYFSSYSESWLKHADYYTHTMIERFQFDQNSQVIEIGSNDGYLLQYFKRRNIPILGIDPAANVAQVAEEKGIPTLVKFFCAKVAKNLVSQGIRADLLLGNNVLPHTPHLNDFLKGMKILLKPHGVITMEFPHLLRLMMENEFDTIYHEHFSYFSLITVEMAFAKHGLTLFDVEELQTHGGSLRIYARHSEDGTRPVTNRIRNVKDLEVEAGLNRLETYSTFEETVHATKRKLLNFMIQVKEEGKSIVGYGAAAKGNTLLNYCGIRRDFIDYTVDRNPYKQGRFLPGTHIPIYHPDKIMETKPDYLLILPWNLKNEIMDQMAYIRHWGGKFVVSIPQVEVIE